MKLIIKKAEKKNSRVRLAIAGPSKGGKTWNGLTLAAFFAEKAGGRLLVIDTERGSASKYADHFDFDVLELNEYHPQHYIDALALGVANGYRSILIDSLSHAWAGKGGALEMVDNAAKRSNSGSTFTAWRNVTPLHNALIDAILGCNAHVVATLRVKTQYVLEPNEKGKMVPVKRALQPIMREGIEYEFDGCLDVTQEHDVVCNETRCTPLNGKVFSKPTTEIAEIFWDWLTVDKASANSAVECAPPTTPAPAPTPAPVAPAEPPKGVPAASAPPAREATPFDEKAATPPPASPAPAPPPKSYLTAVSAEKKRVGDTAYAMTLQKHGISSPEALTTAERQRAFYLDLKAN